MDDFIGSYMQRSLDMRLAAADPARKSVVDSLQADTQQTLDMLDYHRDEHVKELVKELSILRSKPEAERMPEYEQYLAARIQQIQKLVASR